MKILAIVHQVLSAPLDSVHLLFVFLPAATPKPGVHMMINASAHMMQNANLGIAIQMAYVSHHVSRHLLLETSLMGASVLSIMNVTQATATQIIHVSHHA